VREAFPQELCGHEALKLQVLGLVNNTHAPAAELIKDLVVSQHLAVHEEYPSTATIPCNAMKSC
jgi:hypothetical protein